MKWKSLPIVAFDTETTGLEPFGGDRIIEFAAVILRLGDDGKVADRIDKSWLINPERQIPRKVTEITGIAEADVADAPPFADVVEEIHGLFVDAITVAHNYPFDMGFLTAEFERTGLHWPEPLAEVDTVDLSMKVFSDARSHKLSDLSDRLDVRLERAHRATDDAAACGYAFVEVLRRHGHDVDDDLQSLLDWCNAIGRPPEGGPIGSDPDGRAVFLEGPHRGEPIGRFPVHLAWMGKAKVRREGAWQWRYPGSVRRWTQRWLEVRGAGRAKMNAKSFGPGDWAIDSCLARPRP
jgi:DNA polymerase III epsilon subunit family exonuclease